mmetsp:Transcript_15268/g.18406  ORF Transcript_15268/g.18406 Transcript_15268/m.18406 type:complete len:234 (-) Transcript_15268:2039-2740(-)
MKVFKRLLKVSFIAVAEGTFMLDMSPALNSASLRATSSFVFIIITLAAAPAAPAAATPASVAACEASRMMSEPRFIESCTNSPDPPTFSIIGAANAEPFSTALFISSLTRFITSPITALISSGTCISFTSSISMSNTTANFINIDFATPSTIPNAPFAWSNTLVYLDIPLNATEKSTTSHGMKESFSFKSMNISESFCVVCSICSLLILTISLLLGMAGVPGKLGTREMIISI